MELHNYRYVRRNGSIDEFIEKEARHRGMDKRQAPFRSTVEERCEPYKEAKEQPPSYRRIEMNNTTFASAEPESAQLLGTYDPELPKSTGRVAFGKASTARLEAGRQTGAHTYDDPDKVSAEIWRAGPAIGRAQRPCSADAINAAKAAAAAAAAEANAAELAATSPRSATDAQSAEATAPRVIDDNTGAAEIEAMRLEVGIRVWVPGGPLGGRGCEIAFVGRVPELGPGWWVGVDYDEALGKNDGSIKGVRYFESDRKHGGFVRPSKLRMGEFDPEDFELEKIAAAQEKAREEKQKRIDAMKSELDPVTSQPFDASVAQAHATHASFRGSVDRFGDYVAERFVGGDSHMRELAPGQYADQLTPRRWQRHDLTITKRVGHQVVVTNRADSIFVKPKSKARKRKPIDKSSRHDPVRISEQEQQQHHHHHQSIFAEQEADPVDDSLYPKDILRMMLHSEHRTANELMADEAKEARLRAFHLC
jgi:hypothetical protein